VGGGYWNLLHPKCRNSVPAYTHCLFRLPAGAMAMRAKDNELSTFINCINQNQPSSTPKKSSLARSTLLTRPLFYKRALRLPARAEAMRVKDNGLSILINHYQPSSTQNYIFINFFVSTFPSTVKRTR
jgi:hypothetical protein